MFEKTILKIIPQFNAAQLEVTAMHILHQDTVNLSLECAMAGLLNYQ